MSTLESYFYFTNFLNSYCGQMFKNSEVVSEVIFISTDSIMDEKYILRIEINNRWWIFVVHHFIKLRK